MLPYEKSASGNVLFMLLGLFDCCERGSICLCFILLLLYF